MAIDGRIYAVTYLPDGTASLLLEPRDRSAGPAGQERLIVLDPPPGLDGLVGECVWGGSGFLMWKDERIAERVGYGRLRLAGKGEE